MRSLILLSVALFGRLALAMTYGTTSQLPWGEYAAREKSFQMARAAGLDTIRCDFNWSSIVSPDGKVYFERTDRIVADAAAYGLKILPILDYEHPQLCPKPHRDPDSWAKFVRLVAERYGEKVPAFEIWNEQDHKSFCGEPSNPTNYLVILKRASEEIRSSAPKAKVVVGGFAGVPLPYIEELYKLGAKELFDIMNVHPYTHPRQPEGEMDENLRKLRRMMGKYGDSDKPVWITEIGWPTHEARFVHGGILRKGLEIADPQRTNWRAVFLTTGPVPDARYLKAMADQLLPKGATIEHLRPEAAEERLARSDVDLVIFPFNESYSEDAMPAVLGFVRRGGVLAEFGGHPMYYPVKRDADGVCRQADRKFAEAARRELRIETTSAWKDPSCPREATTYPVGDGGKGISTTHFLSGAKLKPGDSFVPLCATTTNGIRLVSAAVYKFGSDMKGAVVAGTMRLDGSWPTSGEARQAALTVRAAALAFVNGVEVFMPYELRAREQDRFDTESHFGLLHNNFVPKPAYAALMNFIFMCPDGSSPLADRNSLSQGCYAVRWRRPADPVKWLENGAIGGEVGMVWSTRGSVTRTIRLAGSEVRFFDLYGAEIFPARDGERYVVELSESPIYYSIQR